MDSCLDFYVYLLNIQHLSTNVGIKLLKLSHPVSVISSSQGVQMSQDAHSLSVSLSRAQSATLLIFIEQKLDS